MSSIHLSQFSLWISRFNFCQKDLPGYYCGIYYFLPQAIQTTSLSPSPAHSPPPRLGAHLCRPHRPPLLGEPLLTSIHLADLLAL